jgi:hypothetical protein
VSIGNILSCDGQTKLADLEYAKNRSDPEMRTASESPVTLTEKSLIASQQGTSDFMSIEVAAQLFLFFPRAIRAAEIRPAFYHNHLHDLESLWWVAT